MDCSFHPLQWRSRLRLSRRWGAGEAVKPAAYFFPSAAPYFVFQMKINIKGYLKTNQSSLNVFLEK